ncbi:plexin-C1 [Pleurodeles waltl]|uniref:plexin-C1 n=1 Tax=Pleurodeles waltl TaxID=8319 RepID=UPI003709821B
MQWKYSRTATQAAAPAHLWFLLLLSGTGCRGGPSFKPEYPIAHVAVSQTHVFITAGNRLYQLNTALQLEASAASESQHLGNRTQVNSLLLVSQEEGAVYTGWMKDGSIEKRNLTDVGKVVKSQTHVVSSLAGQPSHGTVLKYGAELYLVIAGPEISGTSSEQQNAIVIYNNNELTSGEGNQLKLNKNETLHFVDAFVWDGYIFTPSTFNSTIGGPTMVISSYSSNNVLSLFGNATLLCHDQRATETLVSSSLVESSTEGALWAGIFTLGTPLNAPGRTALCIFNLTDIRTAAQVCYSSRSRRIAECNVYPILKSTTLRHSSLTSVYGIEVQKRLVVFMGTENGQLLKVSLDKNFRAGCPEILYETDEESPVLPELVLDPTDKRYIYLPTTYEVVRVKVSGCDQYKSCRQCLLAEDPYCGWCQSNARCTFQDDCVNGNIMDYWVSVQEGAEKCLQLHFIQSPLKEVNVTIYTNLTELREEPTTCRLKNTISDNMLCESLTPCPSSWSCKVQNEWMADDLTAEVLINNRTISERYQFANCVKMQSSCTECVRSGCVWCKTESMCRSPVASCTPQNDAAEQFDCSKIGTDQKQTSSSPNIGNATAFQVINAIDPSIISIQGKTKVIITGQNFTEQTKILLIGTSSCPPVEINVTSRFSNTRLEVSLPPGLKETKTLCINFDGEKCLQGIAISYISVPQCYQISPKKTWVSGGRKIIVHGKNLHIIDHLSISHPKITDLHKLVDCSNNETLCQFESPVFGSEQAKQIFQVKLHTGATEVYCDTLEYLLDPQFTSYSVLRTAEESESLLKITKEKDDLDIEAMELEVLVMYMDKPHQCVIQNISSTTILCKSQRDAKDKISEVVVKLGNFKTSVKPEPELLYLLALIPVLLIIIIVAAILITRHKSRQLSRKLSLKLELLESDLRNEIRHGFAELQIDQSDVVDTAGTIPFLDYKHFAIRTFFPESTSPDSTLMEELCNAVPPPFRSPDANGKDECLSLLCDLIGNKDFLVALIHTLEKQKAFSIKDRCRFASFLTIALQSKLVYLTHILEVLIRDLMEQSSNAQPKLMLRRTESVVEKLLTNWMSTCLYGFLRETVGEPLYMLVTTLNQRIHKGPVDAISCKALYTLNEDWLLWQVSEFNTVTLNVDFPKLSESESEEDYSQNIPVKVLDCDSIGQIKEKIFEAYLNKNGYPYGLQLCEASLELLVGPEHKELLDLDQSSVTLEHGKTKINTVLHYKLSEGSTISVIKKSSSCTSDGEYTDDYCHLILPDIEETEDIQGAPHKGKQKFKVKEMYLTKLISTKVAVDSAVEALFRSIWGVSGNRVPVAIKFFFDFLDAQYENKKINDPDVPHIWKTNSLPLRFWVNILKNPQFVFDIKKTPHLDGCLSVIAQAFIDSFSLSEQMLGKESPTNKLLYAKDMTRYKHEVKEYYSSVQNCPSLTPMELEAFLNQESKKHENEFKEDTAMLELYKYITSYYEEVLSKLEKDPELEEARKQLVHLKAMFEEKKKCKWE